MVALAEKHTDHRILWRQNLLGEARRFAMQARSARLRTRVEFAEQCVRLPEGPHAGKRWRRKYQPYAFFLLKGMDDSPHRKFRFTGCVQSGKTLNGPAIVTLWHLFERGENVVYGIPDIKTAEDKWKCELLPLIEASPELRRFLPSVGTGSKGGFKALIKFKNGAMLRFMGAFGRDHNRSNFTAAAVVKTEVDRYDESNESSRESPPVDQMDARTEAFGDQAWSYEECTVTTEDGRIWTEKNRGTNTTVYMECPYCGQYVLPMRDDVVGIEDAEDVDQAVEYGYIQCPKCSAAFSDTDRERMLTLEKMLAVAEGQSVEITGSGPRLIGEPKKTDTFSFWWNEFHNKFHTIRKICRDEWNALYSSRPSDTEKYRRQFAWTLPAAPTEAPLVPLTLQDLLARKDGDGRGIVPPGTLGLSAGSDLNSRELHYVVKAWGKDGKAIWGKTIDLGTLEVGSDELGVKDGLMEAMRSLRDDILLPGYRTLDGQQHVVNFTLIDGGFQEETVFDFMFDCQALGIPGFMMILGRGQSEPPGKGAYNHPDKETEARPWIGEQWYVRKSDKREINFVMANSDVWKSSIHWGVRTPRGRNGALFHFTPVSKEEKQLIRKYCQHRNAERCYRRKVPRRGVVDVWVNETDRENHFFDADYYGSVGGSMWFDVLRRRELEKLRKAQPGSAAFVDFLTRPDGMPFMATRL